MSTKKRFMQIAGDAGISVEYTAPFRQHGRVRPFFVELGAPEGKIFLSSGAPCDNSIQGDDDSMSTDWPRACRELELIISAGFEDTDEEE